MFADTQKAVIDKLPKQNPTTNPRFAMIATAADDDDVGGQQLMINDVDSDDPVAVAFQHLLTVLKQDEGEDEEEGEVGWEGTTTADSELDSNDE